MLINNFNICTCVSDPETVCIIHPSRDKTSKYKARSLFAEHANRRLDSDNICLESDNKVLRAAIQAALDCGMIPTTTASDGGAARHSEQVRVADMLRAAIRNKATT